MSRRTTQQPDFAAAALEHLDALYGFAMVLTRNRAEAEDLVQETYLRATQAFGRLLPDSHLKSWLFTIMRNLWLNQVRHAKLTGPVVELDAEAAEHWQWPAQASCDPHSLLLQKVQREQIRAALERLPVHYREVIVLRDFEEFSYQQIAAILACPAGTVMSRLGRAREQLRALLSEWRAGVAAAK